MTYPWTQAPDGTRRWRWAPTPTWRGGATASDVIVGHSGAVALPRRVRHLSGAPRWALAGMRSVGADAWEARVLGAIASHETGWRRIMNYQGGSDAGYFQIIASTATALGTTTHALMTSDSANYTAGLRLLRWHEHAYGRDAISMFAAWYAGHVSRSSVAPYYVAVHSQTPLDFEVDTYNRHPVGADYARLTVGDSLHTVGGAPAGGAGGAGGGGAQGAGGTSVATTPATGVEAPIARSTIVLALGTAVLGGVMGWAGLAYLLHRQRLERQRRK